MLFVCCKLISLSKKSNRKIEDFFFILHFYFAFEVKDKWNIKGQYLLGRNEQTLMKNEGINCLPLSQICKMLYNNFWSYNQAFSKEKLNGFLTKSGNKVTKRFYFNLKLFHNDLVIKQISLSRFHIS